MNDESLEQPSALKNVESSASDSTAMAEYPHVCSYQRKLDAVTARAEQLQTWNDELRTQLREIRAQQKEDYTRAERAEASAAEWKRTADLAWQANGQAEMLAELLVRLRELAQIVEGCESCKRKWDELRTPKAN